jgi:large subunit ribosomal protein L28
MNCDVCAKRRQVGNKISHSNIKTLTRQQVNIQRVHVVVDGARKHLRVCTRCLRSGKVQKAG